MLQYSTMNEGPETLNPTTYTDSFGIERRIGDKIGRDRAKMALLPELLKLPHLLPFLGITPAQAERLEDDPVLYRQCIDKLADCPRVEPYIVVPDEINPDKFYFFLDIGVEKTAIKENGTFYIVSGKTFEKEIRTEVEKRINLLSQSGYFPEIKILESEGACTLSTQFIPHTSHIQRGEDVSDFIETCRTLNFGPDTNVTNFQRLNGNLKYIDGDILEWIIEPSTHPFDESASRTKPIIW